MLTSHIKKEIDCETKHDECHIRKDLTHKAFLYVIAVVSNPAR